MAYTAPALTAPVLLAGGYAAPALTIPVVLGEAAALVPASMAVSLSAPLPSLALAARQRPIQGANSLWVAERLHRPAALTFIGRERAIMASLAVSLPAPLLSPLAVAGVGLQILDLPDAAGPRLRGFTALGLATAVGRWVPHATMIPSRVGRACPSAHRLPLTAGVALAATHGMRVARDLAMAQVHGRGLRQGLGLWATDAQRCQRQRAIVQAHGRGLRQGLGLWAADQIRTRQGRTLQAQTGLKAGLPLTLGQQHGAAAARRGAALWTQAALPLPGLWWPFYRAPGLSVPVVLSAPYTPRPLHCPVRLSWTWIVQPYCAGFDPGDTIIIPVRRVYFVINSFSLVRADTGQPVDALDFSATLDADAWGWSWSATIPARQESRVRSPALGEFMELIATLNGTALRLVVERFSRSRQFGSASIKISGRGRAAWLAEPHSPMITVMNAEARTAQQLLNDALTVNGVPLGWAVDWQVEDWSVPAGLFSHTGTSISAAQRLAEAAGGYVQADHALQILHILPCYPVAPWNWATETPEIALPEDVCLVEEIEWQDKPAYNAVWIVGQDQGRRDQVKRTGTAGDRLAPTVVDPLATSTVMTRQRGLRVIADTGRQVHLSLKLPILAETGIMVPGQLIEYTEQGVTHRGLSRAVSVTYGFPQAWQTVKVETHELESV